MLLCCHGFGLMRLDPDHLLLGIDGLLLAHFCYGALLVYFAPLNELKQEHADGNNQQDMNEATHRVAAGESKQPKDKKNHGDCKKHGAKKCGTSFW